MGDIYYKLDRNTRADLIATVRRAAIEILEGPQENWITARYSHARAGSRVPIGFLKGWRR